MTAVCLHGVSKCMCIVFTEEADSAVAFIEAEEAAEKPLCGVGANRE